MKSGSYDSQVTLNMDCRKDLRWWIDELPHNNVRPLQNLIPQLAIETDASHHGMGYSYRSKICEWQMVARGEVITHQSFGAQGCRSGSEELCRRLSGSTHSPENGQPGGNCIPECQRRHEINKTKSGSSQDLGLVPSQETYHSGHSSSREDEHEGRQRVKETDGAQRLEAGFSSDPEDSPEKRSTGSRPLCGQTQCTASELLQLASRSGSLSTRLEACTSLCLPTVLPDRTLLEKSDGKSGIQVGHSDSGVEVSNMVCSPVGAISRDTSAVSGNPGSASGRTTSTGSSTPTPASRLDSIVGSLKVKGVSSKSAGLICASWRKGTEQSYSSAWRNWMGWCNTRKTSPLPAPVTELLDFLQSEYSVGKQYTTLNSYRSAISATHIGFDGRPAGQHPLICRLMQGVFNSRPPQPKNVILWDVEEVLRYLEALPPLEELDLKTLTFKTAILFALSSADRVSDLQALDIRYRTYTNEGVRFIIPGLTKTRRSGPPREVFYPEFGENRKICAVAALREYEKRTSSLRPPLSDPNPLFISLVKPHKKVSPQTMGRWIKSTLALAGIDTSMYGAHSTRGVSTSTAKQKGVALVDVMSAANWKRESTFSKFHHRPTMDNKLGRTVLATLTKVCPTNYTLL